LQAGSAALLLAVEDKGFDFPSVHIFSHIIYADYAWDHLLATAREPAKIKLFGKQAGAI
jgi:hypothetical protein